MEKIEFVLDNWMAIIGIFAACAGFIVSPIVILRHLRSKNEIAELATQFQRDDMIRTELTKINTELMLQQKKIAELEKKLLASELRVIELTAENKELTNENQELIKEISELKNP